MYVHGKVISNEKLSGTLHRASIKLFERARPPRPLQFVNIVLPGIDELPMTVSDFDEGENALAIIYKVRGEGTAALSKWTGYLGVKGFYGNGVDIAGDEKILFVAGGSGIAGYFYLAKKAVEGGGRVDLAWGVRSSSELFNVRAVLGREPPGDILIATEDCSAGYCGLVTDLLAKLSRDSRWDLVILVGPEPMLERGCEILRGFGRAYVSAERIVKCGIGICGSCSIGPRLLCVHGPVLSCEEYVGALGWRRSRYQ